MHLDERAFNLPADEKAFREGFAARLAASNDIAAAHVNGVFHTGDIDALAEAVAHLYALDLSTEQDGDLLLRARME